MVLKLMKHLLFITMILNLLTWANTDLFTAIVEMEPLLKTHKKVIDELESYIQKEETRLNSLRTHLNQYTRAHEKAMEDIPNYLGNPINAFTLIKRLTTDLDLIEERIKKGTEHIKNVTMNHSDVKYPTLEDLTVAAQALTRLQETYKLNVHELAQGMLNGIQYTYELPQNSPMSAHECYELGKAQYNDKEYKFALAWMTEALRKLKEDDVSVSVSEADILEYIAYTHYLLGDAKSALEWTHKLLAVDPDHVRALGNVAHFSNVIKEEERLKSEEPAKIVDTKQELVQNSQWNSSVENEQNVYHALCRGEIEISRKISKRLKCFYITKHHPFLKYAPIKTEQMYIQPDVFVFHEVLSDDEIEAIKSIALPLFHRSYVHDAKDNKLIHSNTRISKLAWLGDEVSPLLAKISQRVSDMTGLSVTSSETLQVVNYGIGGHYVAHQDFARRDDVAFYKDLVSRGGNRIATILFYMSDVAQGGATVFTELGLSLFPVKRAAAFWLNLHPSGEGDMATSHAACPVLRGSKWAANKWLHLEGQEWKRPCNLEFQPEGFSPEFKNTRIADRYFYKITSTT